MISSWFILHNLEKSLQPVDIIQPFEGEGSDMGVLQSRIFAETDSITRLKLENCATGIPNEALSHFSQTINSSGLHIRLVQRVLQRIIDFNKESSPILGFNGVSGVYTREFASSVRTYKEKRGIRNFAGKFDDIIGIKTIKALDREADFDPSELRIPHLHELAPKFLPSLREINSLQSGYKFFRSSRVGKISFAPITDSSVDTSDLLPSRGAIFRFTRFRKNAFGSTPGYVDLSVETKNLGGNILTFKRNRFGPSDELILLDRAFVASGQREAQYNYSVKTENPSTYNTNGVLDDEMATTVDIYI